MLHLKNIRFSSTESDIFEQCGHIITLPCENKKIPANANGNAQQRHMFESPVKQNLSQSWEGARRPAANYL